jgi:hypothetical protein
LGEAGEIIFPNNSFLRSLVLAAIIVSVTDPLMFHMVWSGRAKITPLFVILVIIVTMVPMAINFWVHIFRHSVRKSIVLANVDAKNKLPKRPSPKHEIFVRS